MMTKLASVIKPVEETSNMEYAMYEQEKKAVIYSVFSYSGNGLT